MDDDWSKPLNKEEKKIYTGLVKEILQKEVADRDEAIIEGFMRFGLRFFMSFGELDKKNENKEIMNLSHRVNELHAKWLHGKKFTKHVDEDERRALFALQHFDIKGDKFVGVYRLAAEAILVLPLNHKYRNVDKVRKALYRYRDLRRQVDDGSDGEVLALSTLIKFEVEPPEIITELINQGKNLLKHVLDQGIVIAFIEVVIGYYILHTTIERDAGNVTKQQFLIEEGTKLFEHLKVNHPNSINSLHYLLYGALLELAGKLIEAADVYSIIVDGEDFDNTNYLNAIQFEARLRFSLGDYDRVIEILSPNVDTFESAYLISVEDKEIKLRGNTFSAIIAELSFAYAYLSKWEDAINILERGKSPRFRHYAALRQNPHSQKLLELETDLYALSRGIPIKSDNYKIDKNEDWFGNKITIQKKILEEFRDKRNSIMHNYAKLNVMEHIPKSLHPNEAVVILGISQKGLLMSVIFGNGIPPENFLLEQWTKEKLLRLFLGNNSGGWLYVLEKYDEYIDSEKALEDLIEGIDNAIGKQLDAILKDKGIERVSIIPHDFLHLVPFIALPSLSNYGIMTVKSAFQYIETKKHVEIENNEVLIVSNPTLDLPLSSLESNIVRQHLSQSDTKINLLERENATQQKVTSALQKSSIFHFCGHGFSDLTYPLRSSLLLHPDKNHFQNSIDDPFEGILKTIDGTPKIIDGKNYVDVPGKGRIYSEHTSDFGRAEVRFEYDKTGTLWGLYQDNQLKKIAELWSANEIMLRSLQNCGLVFLSACESGSRGFTNLDESSGLLASFQLAGVSTIIATLWPVTDIVTVFFVNLFYKHIQKGNSINIPNIVRDITNTIRDMKKEQAISILNEFKKNNLDMETGQIIEQYIKTLDMNKDKPFEHPYHWGSFVIMGSPNITIK